VSNRVVATIDIDAPPQEIWDIVMDPARAGDWVTIHRRLGKHDTGPLKRGFRMEQTLCLRGMNFKVKWELTEVDAPSYARWEGKGPARSKALIIEKLVETEAGTCFRYENEFKAPLGPLGSAASRALVGGLPKREASTSLEKLKALVESGG
jgi:carbon monoxide dehydrogenase subunit G